MTNSALAGLDTPRLWSTEAAFQHLQEAGLAETKRTAERFLQRAQMLPQELTPALLRDETGAAPTPAVLGQLIDSSRAKRKLALFAQLATLPGGVACLHVNDARGGRYWRPFTSAPAVADISAALAELRQLTGKDLLVLPHAALVALCRAMPAVAGVDLPLLAYAPPLAGAVLAPPRPPGRSVLPHLRRLEAESLHILREALVGARAPAMLYSMGKDSSVLLHLARKAFYPGPLPFPLLHVDTRWKFRQMYAFRDRVAQEDGVTMLVHINPAAIEKDINPFDHGAAMHTDITKTEGLRQALDQHGYDVVFGGARRDEEKSRAKERIFSVRNRSHRWDPKNQRPEPWNLYNTSMRHGDTLRVFPLSNWTELDIWEYIHQESIPVVPLYFAQERPVVRRDGMLVMVDDARMQLQAGEQIEKMTVRFRSLGCYPLSGAIASSAHSVEQILLELGATRNSERQGRLIDGDGAASMEKKKQEGYF